jgi:hypothetical protein
MKKSHNIQEISFLEDTFSIKVDGKKYCFKISDISQKLEAASPDEREKYELSPSGYGIHWPALDEDLSIDRLLGIKHKPSRNQESISA